MKQGHGKVLAKNSTYPYFSVNCPCQEPILTGHWFADYIEYNMDNQMQMNASYWPYQHIDGPGDSSWDIAREILQTNEIATMSSVNVSWKPSAVINPQYQFYDNSVPYHNSQGSYSVYYRTGMLTETQNNFILPIKLFKENRWWNYYQYHSIVSGNSASGIYDCYNLSTIMGELRLSKLQSSGFISSIIVNNCDNNFRTDNFITVNSLWQYSIPVNDNNTEIPTLTAGFSNDTYLNYAPLNNKVEAGVNYYCSRIYKGDQEGYVFTVIDPTEYETGLGPQIVWRNTLAGSDNVPVTGRPYYFFRYNLGDSWLSLRKIGNKYYGYDLYDQKTIVQYPASAVQSTALQWDNWSSSINRITTGLVACVLEGRWTTDYNILSTSDGLMLQESNGEYYPISQFSEQYMGEYWSNYQYTVGRYTYYTTKIYDHTGQYFITQPYEEEIIGDINYNWEMYVCFPTDYNSTTSTATLDVYKFGYYYDNDVQDWVYCSGFTAASTTILTARVWDYQDYQNGYMQDPQPQVQWDSNISAFFYDQGGGIHNHPLYTNYYFTLSTGLDYQQQPIYETFYVYQAPAWGVLKNVHKSMIFDDYIVTGNSYDTVECWTVDDWAMGGEPDQLVPISTGYYCKFNGGNGQGFLATTSGQDYWYVISGIYDSTINKYVDYLLPLTGGDILHPQKSVAVDNPDRPPYWYFSDGSFNVEDQSDRDSDYYSDIESCRYICLTGESWGNYRSIGVIIPIYYDTYYGNVINYYDTQRIDGILTEDQSRPIDTFWPIATRLITNHAYNSTEGFCCPFVKYNERHDKFNSGENDPTITNFLNGTPTVETTNYYLYDDHYPREFMSDWGGDKSRDDGTDYNYDLAYQYFTKMTEQQIRDPFSYTYGTIDWDLSAVLPYMDSLYCQILTGVWIRKKSDDDRSICGIRKHGYFNQLLSFNTEYKFGYDLTNINDLDALLSNDTSICYQRNGNSYVARQVKDYWNDIKNTFNRTISQMNTSKFRTFSHIRVLSGHFSIPVQP